MHDLTKTELADFIKITPKGISQWRWVTRPDAPSISHPCVTHDGQTITSAKAWGVDDTAVIVRAVYDAHVRRRQDRSKAAKRAAVTRARRRELEIHRIAEALIAGGQLQPSQRCMICGKDVTDDESIRRGIGSDCWQRVLREMEVVGSLFDANEVQS